MQEYPSVKYSQAQIEALEKLAAERLDHVLDKLGIVGLSKRRKFYVGACPVHGGDNVSSFNVFHSGTERVGNWRCFTHNCHKHFYPSIVGLVRGVLSHVKNGWSQPHDTSKEYPFCEAVKFLAKTVGFKLNGIEYDEKTEEEIEQRKFVRQMEYIFGSKKPTQSLDLDRDLVISSLKIPAPYFISRGFSPEILKKYDVGFCGTKGREMYMRAVAPIYDDDYKKVIGCTGRSVFEKCPLCSSYHNPSHKCPPDRLRPVFKKWKNNDGFTKEYHLYNYWFAKEYIRSTKIAILVESPGNVWRLEECGFHNSLGMFGAAICEPQRDILDKSGALALIILTDPDPAGYLAIDNIRKELGGLYQLYTPRIGTNDIADTDKKLIIETLNPLIANIQKGF